uniref:Uncharacterized protein n=1 Tax=Fagus sylvatica TaxID=28930 RepID=A0A2N9G7P1_FAGSY
MPSCICRSVCSRASACGVPCAWRWLAATRLLLLQFFVPVDRWLRDLVADRGGPVVSR